MAKRDIPTIGKPIFTLSVNSLNDKIKVTTGFNYINSLSYVAVNAVKCMSVGYTDDTMQKIIVNKDYKGPNNEDMSIVIDSEENKKAKTSQDIFVDEMEANAIAIEMNKQFKSECKTILDMVGSAFHEYDNVIAGLKIR